MEGDIHGLLGGLVGVLVRVLAGDIPQLSFGQSGAARWPLWVRFGRGGYVSRTAGVPPKADDLLQAKSADSGHQQTWLGSQGGELPYFVHVRCSDRP
jgi:hypothetical protein